MTGPNDTSGAPGAITETQRNVLRHLAEVTGRRNAAEIARAASPAMLYQDVERACEQLDRRGLIDSAPALYAQWVREYAITPTGRAAVSQDAATPDRPTYRERREARAERRREWAEKRAAKAGAAFQASDAATSGIPFGQPILAGHHSQRRHERAIERGQRQASAGLEHSDMARHHEQAARAIEHQLSTSIYSDDPDAIERLTARIADLEALRDERKSGIAAYNASVKKGSPDPSLLHDDDRSDLEHPALRSFITKPDGLTLRAGRLTNLTASIARNRQRLASMTAGAR